MSEKKNLLVVAPYFPPHTGGLERYVLELVKGIQKDVWNVVVLTTSETRDDVIESMYGCTVHRVAYSLKVSNTPFSFSWFLKIKKILRTVRQELVNIHMPVPGLGDVVAFLTRRSVPIVVTYHAESMKKSSMLPDVLVSLYEHGPLVYLLGRAKHIVCSSDAIRHGFLSRYAHKSSTVTPGVNTGVFKPEAEKWGHPTMLFVASLNTGQEYKGLERLLAILPEVRKEIPDVVLRVVGDGDKRAYYESIVKEKQLGDVVFTGALEGERLAVEYGRAHLLVHPTSKESFGMVIAEALACGLPVLSTNVGGIPELVEQGVTGTLVEPDDIPGFTKNAINLLRDTHKLYEQGMLGRKRILKQYTWERCVKSHEALFLDVQSIHPRVAHIVGYFPPHTGGMEVVAKDVSKEMVRRGYVVEVFTSDVGTDARVADHDREGYTLHRLYTTEFAHTPFMWTLPLRLLLLPRNTILHLHLAQAFLPEVTYCVSRLRKLALIVHFHLDVEPSGTLGSLFLLYKRIVLPRVLRGADRVVVFSEEQEAFVCSRYGVDRSRVNIIPNGIDTQGIAVREDVPMREPFRLLYVGRLTVQKRVDRLVEAVGLLDFPVELTIVGDGEDRKKLEELASTCCSGTVRFEGNKTPLEARAYLAHADVFVIPSDKEGMPLSVIEALVAGLPVVGSNVMGIRELIAGAGVLVDDPSPTTFAEALRVLHGNPDRLTELSKQSKARGAKYTMDVVGGLLDTIYTEVRV